MQPKFFASAGEFPAAPLPRADPTETNKEQGQMEAKLVIVSGAAKTGEFALKLPTIIGRSRNVDLPLGHALVSRQHCKLFEADGVLKLKDLGSLNGTYIDDERITDETVLMPGAKFTVGPVTFRAVYGDMASADDSSGFGAMADVVLPPRASDEDGIGDLSGTSDLPIEPSEEAAPQPAPAAEPSAKPVPSAASELKTEALKSPSEAEKGHDFSMPDAPAEFAPAEFDAAQFDWLEQSPAGEAAAGESDTADSLDFILADIPDQTPSAGPSQTPSVGADPTLQAEAAAPAAAPAKREAKKQPAKSPRKGLFARGAKPEPQKPPAPETAQAKPAEPSSAPDEQPPPVEKAADVPAVDELDFTLPPAKHEGPSADSSLKNTLDFLN